MLWQSWPNLATTDEATRSKITGLYDYIHRNQAYIVNYDERKRANKTYTSQVAESHIDSLINTRHKRTKKMQWTREGAHHVLQIRAMMAVIGSVIVKLRSSQL